MCRSYTPTHIIFLNRWSFVQVPYTHIHYIPQQLVICAGLTHPHTLYSSIGGHLCRSHTPISIIFLNSWSFVQVLYTHIHYVPQQVVICAGLIHLHTLYSSTGGHLCRSYTPIYIIFLNRWSFVKVLHTHIHYIPQQLVIHAGSTLYISKWVMHVLQMYVH